jgi:toxin ParE1/3/4
VSRAFEVSPQARRDLYGILDYLAERNPKGAERVRVEIMQTIGRLAERPGIGHKREDLTDRPLLFRSVRGR